MGKTAVIVLVVTITMIKLINGIPNLSCTSRGGYCSDSDTCSSLGGQVEKLSARCKCGNPCCKCTDTCPEGSTCMSEGGTCDGTKDLNGCCGNRFCCTPPVITTPAPCEPNLACTGLGGNCSDSDTCPDLKMVYVDQAMCRIKHLKIRRPGYRIECY